MDTTTDLEAQVKLLMLSNEDQLLEQIGIRQSAIELDLSVAGSVQPRISAAAITKMGLASSLRAIGARIWSRWNRAAFELVCGKGAEDVQTREKLGRALGAGRVAAAGALAAALIAIGISPALAPVIAAIVMTKFFNPAYEEFCNVWQEKLQA
jgi:hypothetical protein